jgi:hypothetical protein
MIRACELAHHYQLLNADYADGADYERYLLVFILLIRTIRVIRVQNAGRSDLEWKQPISPHSRIIRQTAASGYSLSFDPLSLPNFGSFEDPTTWM